MSKRQLICMLIMTIGIALIAGCVPLTKQYTLYVSTNGEGTVSPTGGQYISGTIVSFTATPKANWKFEHWSGDASGNEPTVTVVMNTNKNFTAHFISTQYAVNATVEGEGIVEQTLVVNPQGMYDSGTTVQLKAVPAQGWSFKEWQGDITGSINPTTITLNKEYNVKAVFSKNPDLAKWNFLVYLDGDNDLESYAIDDINEMEKVGSTLDLNILVLIDRNPNYDNSNGDWSGTRLYRITKDVNNSTNIVSELVQDYGELDMSDPQVLENFLLTCQQAYSAERTILTLWDHGDGIYPKAISRVSNLDSKEGANPAPIIVEGICWDDTTGTDPWSCLTADEIASALANVRQVTGKKIEIINMDACLMQTLEVAYEWRNEVNYLVGSQAEVPGGGNNYETLLEVLKSNPTITTLEFAQTLVNDYYNHYSTNGEGTETYSALSLGVEFDNLITAFKAFATALYQTTDLDGVYRSWNNTTWFSVLQYNDLYDLSRELINKSLDTNVVNKATALQQAIGNAVVNHKEMIEYQGKAFGLSIFLATAEEWPDYSESNQYVSFLLSKDTDWDEFILRFVEYTGSTTPGTLLSVKMIWSSGDCNLGIWEPDNNYYWIDEGPSPNGIFSENITNGGTEIWNLNTSHTLGLYTPLVYSYDYMGSVNCKLTFNGETFYIAINVEPGVGYTIGDFQIDSVQGVRQLTYKVRKIVSNTE
ncbi:MAG: hypothetical protein KAX49_13195 [Halanaerobiales bacterium]|nr:hypothetical protein [Halanaerobiales bacterium]